MVVDSLLRAVEQAATRHGALVVPVTREEIRSALLIPDPSVASVRAGLIARHPYLALQVGTMVDVRTKRPRSERERHWDPALLAAAAAFTLIEQPNTHL